jgi:dimethylhistidine N-methyltransferase
MLAGNSWEYGWPMATSKSLQFLANDATALAAREGLSASPKWLPSKLFYDEAGSALFEQITELPEYYLSRTERSIFESYASEILQAAGTSLTLVELGAGTASKTCVLIEELLQRQSRALFYPIDVSPSALQEAVTQLGLQFPQLRVNPIVADYTGGVEALNRVTGRKLVLYIGSSIGNFELDESVGILRRIRRSMRSGDALLLGADFAKSPKILLPAYEDSQGVTAAFNKNILARLNRELDADFDLDAFTHIAEWNKRCSRMEIYLESSREQRVFLPAINLDIRFSAGERIHTENSYKYTMGMIEDILRKAGFSLEQTWHDRQNWFGVHLARV